MRSLDVAILRLAAALMMLSATPQAQAAMVKGQNDWAIARAEAKRREMVQTSRQDLSALGLQARSASQSNRKVQSTGLDAADSQTHGLASDSNETTPVLNRPVTKREQDPTPATVLSSDTESLDEPTERGGKAPKPAPTPEFESAEQQQSDVETEQKPSPPNQQPQASPQKNPLDNLTDSASLDDSISPTIRSEDPIADAGGPYEADVSERVDGGWLFTFDSSGSLPGDGGSPILKWIWDFGVDTFDGTAINHFKWDVFGALQDEAIITTGHGSNWRNYCIMRDPLVREYGAAVEATLVARQTNGHCSWGLANAGATAANHIEHGFYFNTNGTVRPLENGNQIGSNYPYSTGVPLELRVELHSVSGASYFVREVGDSEWQQLHDGSGGDAVELYVGSIVHSGTLEMDNLRVTPAGEILQHKVYASGMVSLSVEDSDGREDVASAMVDITGPALQIDAGGPYVLDAADRDGIHWVTSFDSSSSSSTVELTQTVWDFGVETFDGTWINSDRWDWTNVGQDEKIYVAGQNAQWHTHFCTREPISRIDGITVSASVTPWQSNGHGLFGLKSPEGYSSSNMAHGFYFLNNGRLYAVDNGNRYSSIPYAANTTYDLKLVLKAGAGARYYVREAGTPEWELLYDSGMNTGDALHPGMLVHSGFYDMDNLHITYRGNQLTRQVYHGGPLSAEVFDAIGNSTQEVIDVETNPAAIIADAGGPYLLEESTATIGGIPLPLDASLTASGPAIVEHLWDFGVNTFDGPRLEDRDWVIWQGVQNDSLQLWGENGWGSSYAYYQHSVNRDGGLKLEASVQPGTGHGVIGFKDNTPNANRQAMAHGVYFADGWVRAINSGTDSANLMPYTSGTWYDVRIIPGYDKGASFWIRETGETEWEFLYASSSNNDALLLPAAVLHSGSMVIDDLNVPRAGITADAAVYGPGQVGLTVRTPDQQQDYVSTSYSANGAPPQAALPTAITIGEDQCDGLSCLVEFDGSASTDDFGIHSYLWTMPVDTFDTGLVDPQAWSLYNAGQADRIVAWGSGSWGSGYVADERPLSRARGAFVQAKVVSSGQYNIWGFLNPEAASYNQQAVVYGIYFHANDEILIYEDGSNRGAWGSYVPGVEYDLRIELKEPAGARYLMRESGSSTWVSLYESMHSDRQELYPGCIMYSGEMAMDDYQRTFEGESVITRVDDPQNVTLTVTDAAFQSSSETAEIVIDGEPPVANSGGPYVGSELDLLSGPWLVSLDASNSTDDYGIERYVWNFGVDSFDGNSIDEDKWFTSNAIQDDRLIIEGTGSWASGYAFTAASVHRQDGLAFSCRVKPSGTYAMYGFKNTSGDFSYTQMPYALYFREGTLKIYEDGTDRGEFGFYDPDAEYDVHIVLKETSGARYFISRPGEHRWQLIHDSDHSSETEFLRGITVNTGIYEMDDLRDVIHGEVITVEVDSKIDVTLTAVDKAGQASTSSTETIITGASPIADAGGPYVAPLGSRVVLDASGSTDDYGIVKYQWDFSNGSRSFGQVSSELLESAGTYEVTLTVFDAAGRQDSATTTIDVQPMVVCVPWDYDTESGLEIPHNTWSGMTARLKGAAFTDTPVDELTYTWSFGDGSDDVFGDLTDLRTIEATHEYTGSAGALFIATLTVHDPVYGDLSDTYPIQIHDQDMTVEVNVAIDEGLWYLHNTQQPDGTWHSYQSYRAGSTASAIQAMQINGHAPTRPITQDPLVENVLDGLDAMFAYVEPRNISVQEHGDPDSNANGIGISVTSDRPIYEGGMVMDALASSGIPEMAAGTGVEGVVNRTFRDIAQDMMDQYAWGQVDSGGARGGWRYSWNSQSDNSAAQWAAIGFEGVKAGFGLDVAQWVKDENNLWLDASYNGTGFGYSGAGNGDATTPSGMVQVAFCGYTVDDPRWVTAEAWLANSWTSWRDTGNVYAFYAFAKAMRLANPAPVTTLSATGLDWYNDDEGLVRYILDSQNTDGGWPDHYGRNLATAWQIVILTPTLFTKPPVARAGEDMVWACDMPLLFDGCGSWHKDPARVLVQYEWDFDGDGEFDYIGNDCSIEHTYSNCPPEGEHDEFEAMLRVTDDIGQIDTDTRSVIIAPPPHAPIAVIGGSDTAFAQIAFIPNPSGSYDIDPTDYITRIEFDFDGSDGYDFDTPDAAVDCPAPPGVCPDVEWIFSEPGQHNIGMRVWDTGIFNPVGCQIDVDCVPLVSRPDFATITVLENHPPEANAGGPYEGNECQPIQLDASLSFDVDGQGLNFAWDLDGDGEYDDATGVAPTFSFADHGEYEVAVEVSDGALTATNTSSVLVHDLAPTISLTGPTSVVAGVEVCFVASPLSECDDIALIEWDWDYVGPFGFEPSGDVGSAVCHTFAEHGEYVVAVQVLDEDDSVAIATADLTVIPDTWAIKVVEASIEVLYARQGYFPDTGLQYAETLLKNVGSADVLGPLVLAFDDLTPAGTYLVDPDGMLPGTSTEYIDFTEAMGGDGILAPGEETEMIVVYWQVVGDDTLFSFEATPYALNTAPIFTTTPPTTATEGVLYRYDANATDADQDDLIYAVEVGPAEMTIDPETGLVVWRPDQAAAGIHEVTLSASDGYSNGTALQSFEITVTATNVAPEFLSTPDTIAILDEQWCYSIAVNDADDDDVELLLAAGPDGMTLDEIEAELCWIPTATGRFYVRLAAADETHVAVQEFTLTVLSCSEPPVITSEPITEAAEGTLYEYIVQATTSGSEPPVYSLITAPVGMTIDEATGRISWTPGQTQGGMRVVKVAAGVDGDPLCRAEQIFEIDVQEVNAPPTFTTTPPTQATEGSNFQYQPQAIDPDNDRVTYLLGSGPEGMVIDPNVGILTWRPAQTAAADYPDGAEVAIAVCDPHDACDVQTFVISIAAVDVPPYFVSRPIYGAREGDLYVYEVEVVDEDGDTVDLSLTSIPDDPSAPPMTIDHDGVITWTPSETAAQRNTHAVAIVADDQTFTASQSFEIFVASVNQRPEVAEVSDQLLTEGDMLVMSVEATDPDGDPLTYTRVSEFPSGVNVHPETGMVEWNVGCNDAGTYDPVVIEVSDGQPGGVTTVEFAVIVDPTNCVPHITSTPILEAAVGVEYSYVLDAFDPEGGTITCALDEGPASMEVTEACHISWTPESPGDYLVRISASDDVPRDCTIDPSACQEFTIHVEPCLDYPEITSLPSQVASAENQYFYQVISTSESAFEPQYELTSAPAGMTIAPSTGLITWSPIASQIGNHDVIVAVYTGLEECRAEQEFSLEVISCDHPPVISSAPPLTAREAEQYLYDVEADEGLPGDVLSYELLESPIGMQIDNDSGLIDWTPDRADVGVHNVRISVSTNDSDCRVEQAFRLEVVAVDIVPIIESSCDLIAYVDELYTCEVIASDANGDQLRYSLPVSISGTATPPAGMTIDPESGLISWTPVLAQIGMNRVVVRAEEIDGAGLFTEQEFDIQVVVNQAPSIVSTAPTIAVALDSYTYPVGAIDPDGDSLTFNLSANPPAMTIDPATGEIEWTPGSADEGEHDVVVSVSDGHGGYAEQTYVLSVLPEGTNAAPSITSVAPAFAAVDCPYEYSIEATDPNGDELSCELVAGPAGMSVDLNSCRVEWIPSAQDLGSHAVQLRVFETDTAEALDDAQSFVIEVVENSAPEFTSRPEAIITVGEQYIYAAAAEDPDGQALTFELIDGPESMVINPHSGLVLWTPAESDIDPESGSATYDVSIGVSDGLCGTSTQEYELHVYADTEPPVLSLTSPEAFAPPNQTFPIYVSATDNVGVASLALTVNGEPVEIMPGGVAYYSSPEANLYIIEATASDQAGNISTATARTLAYEEGETTLPIYSIISPADGSTVTEPVDIIGSIDHETMVYWTVSYKPATAPDTEYVEIGNGNTNVTEDVMGHFDPTTLMNGLYNVRLYTLDDSGMYYDLVTTYLVDGGLKIGNFSVSYTDLEIPLAGLPITIKRTYDSRNKSTGDFGTGWTLDAASIRIEEGVPLHEGWQLHPTAIAGIPAYFFLPEQAHMVNVAWPGGSNQTFMMQPPMRPILAFEYAFGVPFDLVPISGTSELSGDMDGLTFQMMGDYLGMGAGAPHPGQPYDPSSYSFTNAEGKTYNFAGEGRCAKLTSMSDRNGNSLDITDDGILHSSGISVTFERDAIGRIVAINDPNGGVIRYEYDDRGDLVACVDAEGNRTTFAYNNAHGLTDTVDPLGRRGTRNEYDDDGRLAAITDQDGHRIEYNHDIAARQEAVTNRLNHTTVYYYDERGNVVLEVDPYGEETSYEYDDRNNLLSTTDCAGRTKEYSYDDNDFVLSESNCSGGETLYTRDEHGNVLTRTDPLGNVTIFEYDENGNLTRKESPDGGVMTYSYNDQGLELSRTNALGYTEHFEYNEFNRLSARIDFAGARIEYEYDSSGNQTKETRFRTLPDGSQDGVVTRYFYDQNNRQIETLFADGHSRYTVYDAAGQAVTRIDKLGRETHYSFLPGGTLESISFPDGSTKLYSYDAAGQQVSSTDRNGHTTRFEYDKLGRRTKVILPDDTPDILDDNPFTETAYDCVGRTDTQLDELGNPTSYAYQCNPNLQVVTDALLHDTTHEFDVAGNKIRMTDAREHTTRFEYDSMNRLTRTTYHDGTHSEVEYDLVGNKILERDQQGRVTRYSHDPKNRLTSVVLFDGIQELRSTYEYDELGNMVSRTDAEGRTTRFEYDSLSREVKEIRPMGQEEIRSYDAAGNLQAKTDFNGDTIFYEYDARGLVTKEVTPDLVETLFSYLPEGQRTRADGKVTQYDERNRPTAIINADGSMIEYEYDDAGNRTALITTVDSQVEITTFEYDELNRLSRVHHPAGGETAYSYDEVGNRSSVVLPNGVTTEYEYDALNRLTLMTNRGDDGNVISAFRYELDESGHRIRLDETTPDGELRIVEYQYDDTYRLVGELIDEPAGSPNLDQAIAYTYDRVGNRLSKSVASMNGVATTTYTYDANDRVMDEVEVFDNGSGSPPTLVEQTTYTYDDNGSLLTRTRGLNTDRYTYDYRARLVAAELVTEGIASLTFAYDADGMRIGRTVAGESDTTYLIDSNQTISQIVVEKTVLADQSEQVSTYVHGDDLLSMVRSDSGASYYLYDGQMSTRQLTDNSGDVTDTYTYDAFGVDLYSTGTTVNLFKYTGEQYDPNLGFYNLRARYYMQTLGRFLTTDSAAGRSCDPASLHKYTYANADPIGNLDPLGLTATSEYSLTSILINMVKCALWVVLCLTLVMFLLLAIIQVVIIRSYSAAWAGRIGIAVAASLLGAELLGIIGNTTEVVLLVLEWLLYEFVTYMVATYGIYQAEIAIMNIAGQYCGRICFMV